MQNETDRLMSKTYILTQWVCVFGGAHTHLTTSAELYTTAVGVYSIAQMHIVRCVMYMKHRRLVGKEKGLRVRYDHYLFKQEMVDRHYIDYSHEITAFFTC